MRGGYDGTPHVDAWQKKRVSVRLRPWRSSEVAGGEKPTSLSEAIVTFTNNFAMRIILFIEKVNSRDDYFILLGRENRKVSICSDKNLVCKRFRNLFQIVHNLTGHFAAQLLG